MKNIRYIQSIDKQGLEVVCQLQYDEEFIKEIAHFSEALINIAVSERNEGISLSLNIYGPQGIEVAYGDILNDDRAQGEFFEIEEGFLSDGLPDETSFDTNPFIELTNLVVTPTWLTLIGYNESGDEISAEILIDDLKPFV